MTKHSVTQEDEFPWIVAILREEAETADESECGGTLVSSPFAKDAFATHSLIGLDWQQMDSNCSTLCIRHRRRGTSEFNSLNEACNCQIINTITQEKLH